MGFAGSQDCPPSIVRANHDGPLPFWSSRSHVAYANPAVSGSAVSDSLSLKGATPSRISVAGSLHVRPPSVDRLARTALDEFVANVSPVNAMPIWYAMPSGPIDTHGSLARAKSPPLAVLPPVQRENFACVSDHVSPPSNE